VARRKSGARRTETNDEVVQSVSPAAVLHRIANLLGLLVVRGQNQGQQAATLSAVGFSPNEIAALLQTKANSVRAALSDYRKGKRSTNSRKSSLE
jgi:hypothetical protein